MEPLSAIAGFISLCNAAIQAGKHFNANATTNDEERILERACHHGIVEIVNHNKFLTVFAEGHLFRDDKDKLICAEYMSAFRSLCEKGSLHPEGDSRFALSAEAFALGRRLAEDRQTFDKAKVSQAYVPYMTEDERELIIAAAFDPNLPLVQLITVESQYSVYVGSQEFLNDTEDHKTRGCAALDRLRTIGVFEDSGSSGRAFRLSAYGNSIAKILV